MREARPDDPIFKTGYVIGEKRQRNSPQDMTGQREVRDRDKGKASTLYDESEGASPEQIDQEDFQNY